MQIRRRKPSVRDLLGCLFLSSLTLCLWLSHVPLVTSWQLEFGEAVTAQNADVDQLVQQGIEGYKVGDFPDAIKQWETALISEKTENPLFAAIVIENRAKAYQQIGESKQDKAYHPQITDLPQVGRILVKQAQAYNSLGQRGKAIALLDSALKIARTYKDSALEVAVLESRGEAYRLEGNYKQAIADLKNRLKITDKINDLADRVSSLNNLGTAYISLARINYRRANSAFEASDSNKAEKLRKQALIYDAQALKYFDISLNIARKGSDKLSQMDLLLNSILPAKRTNQVNLAAAKLQQALALLKRLSDSQDKVYASIKLANFVQSASVDRISLLVQCPQPKAEKKTLDLLHQAVSTAQRIHESRSQSFALGNLGRIYECRQDYQQALKLTRQAEWVAEQNVNAKDSLYMWQWQTGRIFKAENRVAEAIKAYEQASETLEDIHRDILIANSDLQFDFQDTVEPIYRQLINLKLSLAKSSASTKQDKSSDNLNNVLATVDSLKLAEIQNYFLQDYSSKKVNKNTLDLVSPNADTAVFSSMILKDRTGIIVSFPNRQNKFKWIEIDSQTLRQQINEFRLGLERRSDLIYNPKQAKKLYESIIAPFAKDLESLQIKTLVFIPDGILHSVPMAALHDGEKFLVEKYAIATTPSLSLIDAKTVNHEKLQALAVGLTKDAIIDGRIYQALSNVGEEISQVEAQIPGSKQLLDDNFTRDRLRDELRQTVYPIIHIATHAEFGNVPEDTFLVTGNNDKLTITQLDKLIRGIARKPSSIELLTLTACETAIGDDRAAFGLAGVAVQAGVRSALASLWSINDAATVKFVTKFYQHWRQPGVSKADALRASQRALSTLR